MKRASYRHAIEVIALNDEPGDVEQSSVECMASVVVVSEIFAVDVARVARDVIAFRSREWGNEFK